jgi:predicted LPLAT superfamily acyltransferase
MKINAPLQIILCKLNGQFVVVVNLGHVDVRRKRAVNQSQLKICIILAVSDTQGTEAA